MRPCDPASDWCLGAPLLHCCDLRLVRLLRVAHHVTGTTEAILAIMSDRDVNNHTRSAAHRVPRCGRSGDGEVLSPSALMVCDSAAERQWPQHSSGSAQSPSADLIDLTARRRSAVARQRFAAAAKFADIHAEAFADSSGISNGGACMVYAYRHTEGGGLLF